MILINRRVYNHVFSTNVDPAQECNVCCHNNTSLSFPLIDFADMDFPKYQLECRDGLSDMLIISSIS